MPLRYVLEAKKPVLAIFCSSTLCFGTKLYPYELIFNAYLEENRIDPICFITKIILSSLFGEI